MAPTATREPGEPRYQRYTIDEVMAAKSAPPPGRRRGFIALVMVVLLTWVAVVSNDSKDTSDTNSDHECKEAIDTGRPWPVYPKGPGRRPRQFRAVLPHGTTSLTIRISLEGEAVWSHTWTRGDRGAQIYDTNGGEEPDTFPATAAIVPFPNPDALVLAPGKDYEYRILVPGGGVSGAIGIKLSE